jgi:(4-O-methyl)-D-glucuronate---lignin esterase
VVKAIYGQLASQRGQGDQAVDLTAKLSALVKNGELSVRIDNSLAGGDPASQVPKELRIEYSLNGSLKRATVQENEMLILPEARQPAGSPPWFAFSAGADGQERLFSWAPATFSFTWVSGRKSQAQCPSVPAAMELDGSWEVRFPPGWGAPERVTFEHLQSWPENSDPGVKYFSGTATYVKEFEIPAALTGSNRELWLDLGVVKNIAEVSLNGKPLGILWKPPFRANVSAAARPGKNTVEIKVTNLWPNRLIGDEQLPPDCEWKGKQLAAWPQWLLEGKPSPTGRLTFTTWHHWTKDEVLLDSGLIGPVTLQPVEELVIR